MRARWAVALTATLAVLFGGVATAASATDPVDLGSGYVVDDAGVLSSGDISAAEQRLTDLYESTGVDLFVVSVDEFTNPSSSEQWANTVAEDNGLGVSQYVLAVATESRQYYISADSAGPLTEQQVADIEATLVPPLRDGDYAGAVTAAADGFQTALGGGTVGGDGGGGGGGFVPGLIVFLVIAAIAGIVIWLIVRSRRRKRASAGGGSAQGPAVEQLSTEELARRASTALIQTDDAVKTSEQELGFANAQFGDAVTVEFETALQTARENLNQAFTLKQQLDDSVPDSEQQTRSWNAQIIRLCEEANAGLDEKAADFDELRKLEQNAPESLARIQQRRGEAAASIDAATASLQTLSTRYASEALATVADNPQQARQRIAFADEQLSAASAAIAAGNVGEAAVSIRAAEEAVGQATLLEDAIDKLGADLAEGERSAAALITELEGDIAAASALPDPQGTVAAAIAGARTQVDAAKANLAGSTKRPLVTLQALEAANAQIDGVVAGVRDAAAQAQRAQQMLGQQMMQAQAQVSAAEDYVTARRGAIGAEARTRLAEAGASLVQAQQLQTVNPEQALQYAQRANQLAAQAIQYAQNDVGAFSGGGGMGGMFGGGSSGGGNNGGGMLGAVLGGIVINSMLGGGGRSSGVRPAASAACSAAAAAGPQAAGGSAPAASAAAAHARVEGVVDSDPGQPPVHFPGAFLDHTGTFNTHR